MHTLNTRRYTTGMCTERLDLEPLFWTTTQKNANRGRGHSNAADDE